MELVLAVAITGILAAVSVPRLLAAVDRLSVRGAVQDVVLALATARAAATRRSDYISFVADPRAGEVRIVATGETLFRRGVVQLRGVRFEVTRESLTFAPTGLGWGAANTTIVLSRGGWSDTVTTSRLGRVRPH